MKATALVLWQFGIKRFKMWKKYKFTHNEESKVFFTSDTHFFHTLLLEERGFPSIAEHNRFLIDRWNERVRPQDNVIHCGDFVLGARDKSKEVCLDLFNKLNGHIYLLWGNHLAGVKSIYQDCLLEQYGFNDREVYPVTWKDKVTFPGYYLLADIKTPNASKGGKQRHFVFCSHYSHRVFIDAHKGVLHACGHSHGSDKESQKDNLSCKRLDVGVDNFAGPLVFDEFLSIMNRKNIQMLDHHNSETNPSF